MDMVGGQHARRMSPEMEAAQARLKHKSDNSLPPRPRLRPEYGPMTRASRLTRPQMPDMVKRPMRAEESQISSISMETTEELAATFVEEPRPLMEDEPKENPDAVLRGFEELTADDLKEGKGPDNNKFTLGGKSPFINTLNLEKRPLSGHSVAKDSVSSVKAPSPRLTTSDTIPTVVANKRKNKKSNIALIIAIILTVIFGAIVGTFVYLAFFQ